MCTLNSHINAITSNKLYEKKKYLDWLKFNSTSYALAIIYGLGIVQTIFGFNQIVLNTVFILVFFGVTLFLPVKDGIKLLPMVLVYFGYSYVEMQIIGELTIYNSILTNLYLLILAVKIIFTNTKVITQKKYAILLLFGCYILLQRLCYFQIIDSIMSLLKIFIIIIYIERIRTNESEIKAFITLFIITIASSYIYNILHINLIAIYDAKNPWREAWRVYQFVGMRDPNNVALQANFCLAFILFRNLYQSKRVKFILTIFLILTSIITISLSGIITTVCLLFIRCFKNIKTLIFTWLVVLLVITVILGQRQITDLLRNSNNGLLQAIEQRMNLVILYYKQRNYYQLTSTRNVLWQHYLDIYSKQSFIKQLFGDPVIRRIFMDPKHLNSASHNSWIDMLLDNGVIGLFIFFIAFLGIINRRRKIEGNISILLALIFIANIFARTLGDIMVYILVL